MESGSWESPGTPRSQGPPSSSGFTRYSGVPVAQISSERASDSTRDRYLHKRQNTKKDRHARHSPSSDLTRLCLAPRKASHSTGPRSLSRLRRVADLPRRGDFRSISLVSSVRGSTHGERLIPNYSSMVYPIEG